ncbi:hypothetical protein K7H09_16250 [Halomonas sp. IOP_14]|uniref:hypothetical protein n=1 Tax=Halomonas sp. IOP_14 TaxID=2873295 RepID=UPI001E2F7C82|nr:hypothetical protein [Halomonas sp. IOP_14]MCD1587559.1 hypothetical protein [Halomonas sp. IOP_14]
MRSPVWWLSLAGASSKTAGAALDQYFFRTHQRGLIASEAPAQMVWPPVGLALNGFLVSTIPKASHFAAFFAQQSGERW